MKYILRIACDIGGLSGEVWWWWWWWSHEMIVAVHDEQTLFVAISATSVVLKIEAPSGRAAACARADTPTHTRKHHLYQLIFYKQYHYIYTNIT